MKIICIICGNTFKPEYRWWGWKAKCPHCGNNADFDSIVSIKLFNALFGGMLTAISLFTWVCSRIFIKLPDIVLVLCVMFVFVIISNPLYKRITCLIYNKKTHLP